VPFRAENAARTVQLLKVGCRELIK
jgi:hypothetical protein